MSLLKRNGFNQQILRRTEQNQMLVFVFSEQNKRIPRVQTANLQNLQPLLFAGIIGMLVAIPAYTVLRVIAARFFSELKPIRRLIAATDDEQKS